MSKIATTELTQRDVKNLTQMAVDCKRNDLSVAQRQYLVVWLSDWAICAPGDVTYKFISAVCDEATNGKTGKGCISSTYNHLLDKNRGQFFCVTYVTVSALYL